MNSIKSFVPLDAFLKQAYDQNRISSIANQYQPFFSSMVPFTHRCETCEAKVFQAKDADLRRYTDRQNWVTHDHSDCEDMLVEGIMTS